MPPLTVRIALSAFPFQSSRRDRLIQSCGQARLPAAGSGGSLPLPGSIKILAAPPAHALAQATAGVVLILFVWSPCQVGLALAGESI